MDSQFERARQVAFSSGYSDALEYTILRFYELLDPKTHFSRSATAWIDPVAGMRDFRLAAESYLASAGVQLNEVQEWSRILVTVLERERNLVSWFGADPRRQLVQRLKNLNAPPANSANQAVWTRNKLRELFTGEFGTYEAMLLEASTGYRTRLIDQVGTSFGATLSSPEDWVRLDSDLAYLATLVQSEGRDAETLRHDAMDALQAAADVKDAAGQLRATLSGPEEVFTVAFVLEGVSSMGGHSGFGAQPLDSGPTWPAECVSDAAADKQLKVFARRNHQRGSCHLFTVTVTAFDAAGAHAKALLSGRQLASQVVAEHRVADARLRKSALVRWSNDVRCIEYPLVPKSISNARTLTLAPVEKMTDSLASYARAREERVPAWAAMACWASLDALSLGSMSLRMPQPRDPKGKCPVCRKFHELPHSQVLEVGDGCTCCGTPVVNRVTWPNSGATGLGIGTWRTQGSGAFLPPHCAGLTVLASVHFALAGFWRALDDLAEGEDVYDRWRELRDALSSGGGGRFVDLDVWREVILASTSPTGLASTLDPETHGIADAGAVLREVVDALGPFAKVWLEDLRLRHERAQRLRNWCASLAERTEIQLSRTKFLRHSVVHRATHDTASAQQLREAAQHIVDAVYQVLPHWLPDREPWEALRDVRGRFEHCQELWNHGRRPQVYAEELVRP